jgi:hypothetical protein
MLVKLTCEFWGWKEITRKKLWVKIGTLKIAFVKSGRYWFFSLPDLVRRKSKCRFTTEINYFISNLISNGKGENGISHFRKKNLILSQLFRQEDPQAVGSFFPSSNLKLDRK